ncbi:MAG: class I SAM-dependent methyltransferase [Desulfovibrio sp.]|jgi:SAM-dependent methyltransferase|nr:class I SAM-dependent methyltransferase [Desulfovibrio sp.]
MDDSKKAQVHAYWNNEQHDPATIGTSSIGTGLPVEFLYRTIGELETLRRYLPRAPFSMLELGCGAGRWAMALGRSLSYYEGVDMSGQQIAFAQETAAKQKLSNIHFTLGDIRNYTPQRQQFDVIYFAGVTQYLDDADFEAIIRRNLPYLVPGGIIVERATTLVGERRYVRDESGYWCVYRLNSEIIAAFEAQGLRHVADEQSYTFLRRPELWRSPELSFFASWGLKNMPTAMHAVMKAFSAGVNMHNDAFCHEGDKVYDHRFFIFSIGDNVT